MKNQFQSDIAHDEIKKRILSQYYPSGSVLSITDLSENLNMSRTPVSVALRRLEADGLIEMLPRKGIVVKTFTKEDFFNSLEVAEALEGMSAYLIARAYSKDRIDSTVVDNMSKIIEELDNYEKEGNISMWHIKDELFHDQLVDFCPNKTIKTMLNQIRNQLQIGFGFFAPTYLSPNKPMSNDDHRLLCEAIKERDCDKARAVAQQHRHRARTSLAELIIPPMSV